MIQSTLRRLIRVAGWLLTPVVAWAVSFLGGWLGATIGTSIPGSARGLWWLIGGGALGAVGGVVGWVVVMRREDRRTLDAGTRTTGRDEGTTG